ncbi:MAG TPA: valine--tRNA ligase, partial [Syntrophales bacterium]|nr:valine--tRNA ligase [Syntrophales bacterium]
ITKIRTIRGEMGIAPAKKLRAILSAPDDAARTILAAGGHYISGLAGLESLETGVTLAEPKGAATGVVGGVQVFVLLEGAIDVAAEQARLDKELVKLDKELAVVSRKLANRDFLAKAAAAVVAKEEEKNRELRDKRQLLEKALQKVRELVS